MRQTPEFVLFWGKQDVFSNFHPTHFSHNGKSFHCSEQAVMYRKAMLFGAETIANQILVAQTPMACKTLGRSKQIPFKEEVWLENRERIYTEVLLDKFSIPKLKQSLLSTGDRTLVEASPKDVIWGIGYDANHPYATQPAKWRGLNLLGNILMNVRNELQKSK